VLRCWLKQLIMKVKDRQQRLKMFDELHDIMYGAAADRLRDAEELAAFVDQEVEQYCRRYEVQHPSFVAYFREQWQQRTGGPGDGGKEGVYAATVVLSAWHCLTTRCRFGNGSCDSSIPFPAICACCVMLPTSFGDFLLQPMCGSALPGCSSRSWRAMGQGPVQCHCYVQFVHQSVT
jgi:hypothetical protein